MGCAAGREAAPSKPTSEIRDCSSAIPVGQDVNTTSRAPQQIRSSDVPAPAALPEKPSLHQGTANALRSTQRSNDTTRLSSETPAPPRMFMPTVSETTVTPLSRRTTQSISSSNNVFSASINAAAVSHETASAAEGAPDAPKRLVWRYGRHSIPVTLTSVHPVPPSISRPVEAAPNPLDATPTDTPVNHGNSSSCVVPGGGGGRLSHRFSAVTMDPPRSPLPLDPPTQFSATPSASVSIDATPETTESTRHSSPETGEDARRPPRAVRRFQRSSTGDEPTRSHSPSFGDPDYFVPDSREMSRVPDGSSWSSASPSAFGELLPLESVD